MRSIIFSLILGSFIIACGNRSEEGKTQEQLTQVAENALGIKLPQSAKNIHFSKLRAFTVVCYLRFDVAKSDLDAFLSSNEILPDMTNERKDAGAFPISDGPSNWWSPGELDELTWNTKTGVRNNNIHWDCHLAYGAIERDEYRIYLCYIEETMTPIDSTSGTSVEELIDTLFLKPGQYKYNWEWIDSEGDTIYETVDFEIKGNRIKGEGHGEASTDGLTWSFDFEGISVSANQFEMNVTYYPENMEEYAERGKEMWVFSNDQLARRDSTQTKIFTLHKSENND